MANFTELTAKDMNETNGGSYPVMPIRLTQYAIALGASAACAAYALYQSTRK